MTKKNMQNTLLSLITVILAVLLSLCSVAGSVILDSSTYKSAAREAVYVEGVKSDIDAIVENTCKQTGLPEEIFKEQLSDKNIEKLIKKNAGNSALILKGRQAIYAVSLDETALLQSMYDYYKAATGVPAQGETQELLKQTASAMCDEINAAIRVIDMEYLAYTYADSYILKTLRYMGNAGPMILIVLIGLTLYLLYRNTKPGETSVWIWGISLANGIGMLVPVMLIVLTGAADSSIPAGSLQNSLLSESSSQVAASPQFAELYESAVNSTVTAFIELAVIWFVIAFFAIRYAIGKPVQFGRLLAKLQRSKKEETDSKESVSTARSAESEISEATPSNDNKSELSSVIKRAASDSLSTILWKRKK